MELELGRCLVVLSELWRNDPGSSSLRLSPLYVTLSGVFIRAAQSLARILSGMLDTFITPLKGFVHLENPNIDAATDTSPRRTGTFWTQNGPNFVNGVARCSTENESNQRVTCYSELQRAHFPSSSPVRSAI